MSTAVTLRDGEFRVASCNLNFAGVRNGDDSRWQASITTLRNWDPDVVLLQEMAAPGGAIAGPHAHLWRTANELGMTPLLGPPGPLSVTGNHPAILVKTSAGLTILDAGPPLWGSGGGPLPSWCYGLLHVPGVPHPVGVYSVHLPARSAQEQRSQAERLASVIAQKGEIAIAGGDWNSFPRTGASLRDLEDMPPHLRPPRMHTRPGPGGVTELEPSYDVDDILTGTGLADAAASLPPDHRDPPGLTATSIHDNGRIDRFYLTPGLPGAAERYIQAETCGSDHHALLLTISRREAAAITPWEPAP
jgi:endonuclease/exonuclease/phosphatase family metal-dependent hydrolase